MNKRVETTALIFVTEYQNCLGKKRIEKNRIFEKFLILRLFQRIWIVIEAYFPLKFGAIFKGKIKLLKKLAQHSLELCHHTFIKQHAASIFSFFFPRDCREEEEGEPRVWPNFHKDDILSIDLYRPNLVATASYDGDVKVWSLETGHVSCVLNANDYGANLREKPVIPLELKQRISRNNAGRTSGKT